MKYLKFSLILIIGAILCNILGNHTIYGGPEIIPEPEITYKPEPIDSTLFIPKDTIPYKGNWVDIQ